VVVLVGSYISGTTVSCSVDSVLYCSCVSVKKGAKDCACIDDFDIKSWEYEEYWGGKEIECRLVPLSLEYVPCA